MAKKPTKLVKDVNEAINKGLARFLTNTQSKLSASSPVDTGRLASSWFIGENIPNRDEAPEQGKPSQYKDGAKVPGSGETGPITIERFKGKVTTDNDYWISNNLPYAARAAYDPGYQGRRGAGNGAWFSEIQNNLPQDMDRAMDYWLKKIK